jgi:integrase
MVAGLHIVSKRKSGKPIRWYVYAWRGGPVIHKSEGVRPKITPAITDAAAEARKARLEPSGDTISALIGAMKGSPEWTKLAASTRANYSTWCDRIREEFGEVPLGAFEDRRMRGDIMDWRDKWADKPRSADMAMQTISRLLSFGFDRGKLSRNVAEGIGQLYDADRSDVIWEDTDFAKFMTAASVEVREGVELAAATGLRRGDLVKLPWVACGDYAIVWKTAKSRGKTTITIPILPEAKLLLARIKERHSAEMAERPGNKRVPLPETVLSNSRWQPWTAMGFGSRFNDAKQDAKLDKHLHDLRGTFVTRCCIAGLNDRDIADIVGWNTKDVAAIRARYTDQARVVIAIGERLARAKGLSSTGTE